MDFNGFLCRIYSGVMPSIGTIVPEYTNAIVTCLCADGKNATPAMLYTFNPAFDLQVVVKANAGKASGKAARVQKAEAQLARLTAALAKYKVDAKRVVYMESESGGKYCAESARIYEHFLNANKKRLNHKDTVIIRDAGKSFTPGGVSVISSTLPALGHQVVLPPILHHYFSVNDNRDHGVAKAPWRALPDHSDDLESSLFLLHQLDVVREDHIRGWFATNFCFATYDKSEAALTKALEALFFGKAALMGDYHDECLLAYYDEYPAQKVQANAQPPKKATGGYVVHADGR
jgi:hypothetical protein